MAQYYSMGRMAAGKEGASARGRKILRMTSGNVVIENDISLTQLINVCNGVISIEESGVA
jgi:hypothetical protein